ncbi:hypothetical protein HK100_010735, partial [Physocladia obscura]
MPADQKLVINMIPLPLQAAGCANGTTNKFFANFESDAAKRQKICEEFTYIQLKCGMCNRRCFLDAALREGKSAAADLLAEWELEHAKLVPAQLAKKRLRAESTPRANEPDKQTATRPGSETTNTGKAKVQQTLSFTPIMTAGKGAALSNALMEKAPKTSETAVGATQNKVAATATALSKTTVTAATSSVNTPFQFGSMAVSVPWPFTLPILTGQPPGRVLPTSVTAKLPAYLRQTTPALTTPNPNGRILGQIDLIARIEKAEEHADCAEAEAAGLQAQLQQLI